MFNLFKITSRVILVLGLIFLSFKPSISNYVAPGTFAPSSSFSNKVSLSQPTPLSQRSAELRSSFHKNDDKHRLPVPVFTAPLVDAFAFSVHRFNQETSTISSAMVSAPSRMSILRI